MAEKESGVFANLGNLSKTAKEKFEAQEALANLVDKEDELVEMIRITAKLRFLKFTELVKNGFTVQQALELCKDPSIL